MRQRDIELLEGRLEHLRNEIDRLEREIDKADPKLQETYRAEVTELRAKKRRAAENLAKVKTESAGSWAEEDVQTGIINVFDDIGARLSRLFDRFGKTKP